MTYQEYFCQAEFYEVWKTLHDVYGESDDSRALYQAVFEAVKDMEPDAIHSREKIEVRLCQYGEVIVKGAPDPQEWLAGREIEIESDNDDLTEKDASEMVGHLLYWSTLYGIKTMKSQSESFSKWLDYGMRGPLYTLPDNDIDKIGESIMVKYIFLDIDGVLNTEQNLARLAIEGKPSADEYGLLFDPTAVARLAEIADATKAEIIVISSWGEALGRDKIIEMWKKRGLPGKAPKVFVPDENCTSKAQLINRFIDRSVFLPYVILDDESVFTAEQEEFHIKINPVTGISKQDVTRSIEILNRLDNLPSSIFNNLAYEEETRRTSKINSESCDRKKLRYWKSTILDDEAYDWSWNFTILRKKLEYNIGYFRFTQRYDGWEKDVDRMVLACHLMEIAQGEDSIPWNSVYVNTNNCQRYNIEHSEFESLSDFVWLNKSKLRSEKAYQLVWTVLRRNMKKWWD